MKTNRSSRTGGILVIVMVIVVTLSLMVAALLNLGKFNSFETERQLKLTRARWIAEAGFEKVAAIIRANAQSLNTVPSELKENFDGNASKGRYEVTIQKTPNYLGKSGVTRFIITSTGKVNDVLSGVVEAAVKVEMRGAPGVDYSIAALSGDSKISAANSVLITGDVYVNGDLSAKNVIAKEADGLSSGINGVVELGGSDSSSNQDIRNGDKPKVIDDLTLFPAFDRTPYTTDLKKTPTVTNLTVTSPLTLSGDLVVSGNVIIEANITGPGKIVATGNVEVPTADLTIGSDVKIVAGGNVTFKNHITIEERVQVFSQADITFETQGSAGSSSTADGVVLLALGNITTKNIDFNGIIYAEGKVYVTAGSYVSGTLIAGTGFDIAANATITYDPSVFAVPNPLEFLTWVLTERRQWQESPFSN